MQPGDQRGGRQGGKTGESILLLFSRCHAWVQTDYSNNLNHIVQLDVTLCDVVQLNNSCFSIWVGQREVYPQLGLGHRFTSGGILRRRRFTIFRFRLLWFHLSFSSSSKLLFRGLLAVPLVLAASTTALE